MTKIMIIDVETTGLDHQRDNIIEFGAALCDWESGKPIYLQSDNIQYNGELDPKIIEITGIENFMLKAPYAIPIKTSLFFFSKIAQEADYYAAHNAKFDFGFLLAAAEKVGIQIPNKQIIDTRYDLPYPAKQKTFQLNYLLTDHGLFNPFAHRATFDAMSTFKLMKEYPLEDILELQRSDMMTIRAEVGYVGKDLARGMGFHWDGVQKKWLLEIKKARFDQLKKQKAFPFKVYVEYEIPF